jgi:hypothetical protein
MMIATWSFNGAKTDTLTGGLTVGGVQRFRGPHGVNTQLLWEQETGASLGLPVEPPTVAGSSSRVAGGSLTLRLSQIPA